MTRTDYNLPVFEDTDVADLNKYTEKLAAALKGQIDRFGNPLAFRGIVVTINDLPEEAAAGDIYNITAINKNYVYSGTEWLEYSDAIDNSCQDMISDQYNPTHSYITGDYCIYNNALYRATANTTGTWNAAHWTATSIAAELANRLVVAPNAGAHNGIYRGKDITDLFYDGTLTKQIAAGTFDDIFVGDYIIGKASGRRYLVADINYRLYCGDTECTTPHILMIPERIMGTAKMNDTNITTGGYVGSKMYTNYLAPFKTVIQNDFGNAHILNHKELLTNAVTNSKSSGWAWYDSTIEIMSENMVYGHGVWNSSGYETGIDKSQLSLFKLDASKITARDDAGARYWYWLRNVASSSSFALVDSNGNANGDGASAAFGVRPAFLIY